MWHWRSAHDPRVRALVLESPYARPEDMVALQVNRAGLGSVPFVTSMSQMIFGWLNSQFRNVQPLKARMSKSSGVAQPHMISAGRSRVCRFHVRAGSGISDAPHELVTLPHGNYGGMADEDKRNYENRIVSFFLSNLPLSGEPLPEIK